MDMQSTSELRFTIPGDCRTKKNHMTIAGSGARCPVCGKPHKQFIKQGSAHDQYASKAVWYLRPRPVRPIDYPVNVKCLFYMSTHGKVDKSNLEACIHDLLVDVGVLEDDNRDIIATTDGSMVLYDKQNPRVEVTITRVENYEQWRKRA